MLKIDRTFRRSIGLNFKILTPYQPQIDEYDNVKRAAVRQIELIQTKLKAY